MKSGLDSISANWVRWIYGIMLTIMLAAFLYLVNRVDAITLTRKELVVKADYNRDQNRIEKTLSTLNGKIDMILIRLPVKE